MSIKDYFEKSAETNEESKISILRTRYYRDRIEEVEDVIINMIEKSENGKVLSVDDERKEIHFNTSKYEGVIKLTIQRYRNISIDMYIYTPKTLPMKLPIKVIERLYKYLDSKLTFVGTSLFVQ